MNRALVRVVAWIAFSVMTAATSQAARPPGGGGPAKFSQCNPTGYDCNILVTLNKQGTLVVETNPNMPLYPWNGGFYDAGQLIGFQNLFATVYSLSFTVKPGLETLPFPVCGGLVITGRASANVRITNIPTGGSNPPPQGPLYYFNWSPFLQPPWAGRCDVVFVGGVAKGGSAYFTFDGPPSGGLDPNLLRWTVSRKTVIPFVELQPAIAKGQTANATVTLYPSPTPGGETVTLNLEPTSGTGSAVFTSTNTSTMTVTQSGSIPVKGTEASSVADNIKLKASVSGRESSDPFSVVWVKLTQVGVGGTNQHVLKKTGADDWENDPYGSEGDTTITNPVWVDSNADGVAEKNEPVALTRGSTPVLTAVLEITPALTLPVNATLKAETVPGSPRSFTFAPRDISLGSSPMSVPGVTTTDTVGTAVDQVEPFLRWSISILGSPFSEFGLSGHKIFVTYGSPAGYYANLGVTARRVKRAVDAAKGAQGPVSIATQTSTKVLADVGFALENNIQNGGPIAANYWAILDQTPDITDYDCITLTVLAAKYLRMIGVPATEDYAHPTGGNPPGDTNAGDEEFSSMNSLLFYTGPVPPANPEFNGANAFEAYFWLDDAGVRKGFTVAPVQGPLLDTNLPAAGDKLKYNVIKTTLELLRNGPGDPTGRQYWFHADGIHFDTEVLFPGIDFSIP